MPIPDTAKALQRVIDLFACYAQWIPHYSKKVKPLLEVNRFPLNDETVSAIESLKKFLSTTTLEAIDDSLPFTVETDASDRTISATLSQKNRPIAFFRGHLVRVKCGIPFLVLKKSLEMIEAIRK